MLNCSNCSKEMHARMSVNLQQVHYLPAVHTQSCKWDHVYEVSHELLSFFCARTGLVEVKRVFCTVSHHHPIAKYMYMYIVVTTTDGLKTRSQWPWPLLYLSRDVSCGARIRYWSVKHRPGALLHLPYYSCIRHWIRTPSHVFCLSYPIFKKTKNRHLSPMSRDRPL